MGFSPRSPRGLLTPGNHRRHFQRARCGSTSTGSCWKPGSGPHPTSASRDDGVPVTVCSASKDGGDASWYKERGRATQAGGWSKLRLGDRIGQGVCGVSRGREEPELARLGSCWGKVRRRRGQPWTSCQPAERPAPGLTFSSPEWGRTVMRVRGLTTFGNSL